MCNVFWCLCGSSTGTREGAVYIFWKRKVKLLHSQKMPLQKNFFYTETSSVFILIFIQKQRLDHNEEQINFSEKNEKFTTKLIFYKKKLWNLNKIIEKSFIEHFIFWNRWKRTRKKTFFSFCQGHMHFSKNEKLEKEQEKVFTFCSLNDFFQIWWKIQV